jgi:hypothetical protein
MEQKKRRGAPVKPVKSSQRFDMRITTDQRFRWTAAANRNGYKSVSKWLKDLADKNA